jgi:hypothetical protein
MALAAATVWEVRTTGNDANGGGFVAGASGTDRSQQAAAQIAYTDLVLATTTTLTSALNPFSAAEVGNILNITGGAGFTTGWYQIVSVSVVTATIDRVGGTLGSTGGTGNLGGALLTPAQACSASCAVGGNTVWVRGGTYSSAVTVTLVASPGYGNSCQLQGYGTTRGDLGKPVLSFTAAVNGLTMSGNRWIISDFEIDGTDTGLIGVENAVNDAAYCQLHRCKVHRWVTVALRTSSSGVSTGLVLNQCEFTDATAGSVGLIDGRTGQPVLFACWLHDSVGIGLIASYGFSVVSCIISNMVGRGIDAGSGNDGEGMVSGSVFYGNGGDGVRLQGSLAGYSITSSIFMNNGGYGINAAGGGPAVDLGLEDYNAFKSNTSGARNGIAAGAHDVTLTADPFTNAAGNDFTLNNTAGGGAACRGAGFPGVLPGL